ncbi:MAG: hypothetical protein HFH64_03875 [Lachnospiraceae bacterium]|nr:hypothetical protein [Lachnospiraceae bacterium]
MGELRIGQVSSIDYANGMIKVLYSDRDGTVSKFLPYLSLNDEYKMPDIGQYVLVAHLSNGSEAGIVLGGYWNKNHKSAVSGKGVYRKELSNTKNMAYIQYDDESRSLVIKADNIQFLSEKGNITLEQIIDKMN